MVKNIMSIGKSGMIATRDKIDLTASNIVNANTTGYKKLTSEFQTLVSSSLDRDSYPNYSTEAIVNNGVKSGTVYRDTESSGGLSSTGRYLDLAITGNGYFRVITSDGSYAYTRNGSFNLDGSGKIVDGSGNVLDIIFNEGYGYDNVDFASCVYGNDTNNGIDDEGFVRVGDEVVGKLNVYYSLGDDDLRSIRDSLFVPKDGVDMIQSKSAEIKQGFLELSNVNISEEMTNLITLQRAYQLSAKGISTADEMFALINQL